MHSKDRVEPWVIHIKKKTALMEAEEDINIDLTLHDVSAGLITEFAEKIVRPYYAGNLNAALQDLMSKTLSEQEFVHAHITHIKVPGGK
jgi:hypothetical protein